MKLQPNGFAMSPTPVTAAPPETPKPLTIGDLARTAGVPASTVRYYERNGLLRPDSRSAGNYRLYGPAALDRLQFIRSAQSRGFTLDNITTLLRFRDAGTGACKAIRTLIRERLEAVQQQAKRLQAHRAALRESLRQCLQTGRGSVCPVLETRPVRRSAVPTPPTRRVAPKTPPDPPARPGEGRP